MAVYDPEDKKKDLNSLDSEELSGLEKKYSRWRDEGRDRLAEHGIGEGGMGRKLRLNNQGKEDEERKALDDKLDKIKDNLGEGGDGGFFKNGKGGSAAKTSRISSAAGGLLKNRKVVAGVGGGVIGAMLIGGVMFNFLHTFQLDHFFKNVDAKTSARLSGSLDVRNRHLAKAYMKIRVQEIEGKTQNDNLYFRADRVDTNKPLSDWYRTMRKSNFEADLLRNQGIQFVTIVDADGNVSPARVVGGSNGIDPNSNLGKTLTNDLKADGSNLTDVLNSLSADEMDQAFTVDSFGSHKAARKSVKEAVNKEVPWYRTFKRRHIRKDIANVTGIKDWRLFETSRDKIAKNKQEMKDKMLNKIVDRYYKNNPASAQMMKCLFSNARCSTNTDPASPDVKTEVPKTGVEGAGGQDDQPLFDENGEPLKNEDGSPRTGSLTGAVGEDLEGVIAEELTDKAIDEATEEATEDIAQVGLRQRMVAGLVRTLGSDVVGSAVPYNPLKIWTWAKRFAKVDNMIGDGSLVLLVYNARRAQDMGLATTYAMGNDQSKSGKLVGDELNTFYDTTKNLGNTEGWAVASGQIAAGAMDNSKARADYCATPIEKRNVEDFAYQCDDEKPGGGSAAKTLTETYEASLGPTVGVIADGVKGVEESLPGRAFSAVEQFVEEKVGGIIGSIAEPIMEATGLSKVMTDFMGWGIEKLMSFLGAAPSFDPGKDPGLANHLIRGSAAMAEASTRASGGIRSTDESVTYSNQMAAEYTAEQNKNLSAYDRYASLSNENSFAASSLFAISNNTSLNTMAPKISNALAQLPKTIGNIFTGRAFAQNAVGGTTLANWSGVETYDIPKVCMELDPLDTQYEQKSNNAKTILDANGKPGFSADMNTLRDTDKFWAAVYEKIGEDTNSQKIAEQIYNCALFDARVMGSLGFVYGYDQDNGYGEKASSDETTTGAVGVLAPGAFAWPEQVPSTVSSCFGMRNGRMHGGIDIYAGGTGTPIFAAAKGKVTHVQNVEGYGPYFVAIQHDNGYSTSYGHMSSTSVQVGQEVDQAKEIGKEGNEGLGSQGSHLHFNVFPGTYSGWDTPNVDPLKNGLVVPPGVNNTKCATS